jgi:hypothetical protein
MKKIAVYVVLVFGLFCAVTAEADQKSYVWTTEYVTLPKGGFEVEYWFTAKTEDIHRSGDTGYEHQVEVEYGITDHWDVSLYQILGHGAGESLKYKGMKFETRYRLGERGQFFVDPLVYLEYKIGAGGEKNAVEGKLVLARDIGKLNIAYNQIVELKLNNGGKAEHEYAVGISYPLHHSLRIGIEGKGSYTEKEHAIGPTISWVSGRFWATLGAAFGLNQRTDDRQIRFVMGVPF